MYLQRKDYSKYLNLKENPNQGQWEGFKARTAVGMKLKHSFPKK
jgi:hypothetical protein